MTQDMIIEGNKLIAEFIGGKASKYSELSPVLYEFPIQLGNTGQHEWPEDYLMFRQSWDWLMPVVEKIEKSAYVKIKGCLVEISDIVDESAPTKIEAVYKAVVEFIKWYNKNKNNCVTALIDRKL